MLATTARYTSRLSRTASRLAPTRALSSTAPTESQLLDPNSVFSEFDAASIRSEVNKLREIENEIYQTVSTPVAAVDWKQWESDIKYPEFVAELKELHDSTPEPDVAEETAKIQKEIEDVFDPIIAKFEKLAEESAQETAELEAEVAKFTDLRENITELPMDEFLDRFPTVKKSIEDDITNNRWFVRE